MFKILFVVAALIFLVWGAGLIRTTHYNKDRPSSLVSKITTTAAAYKKESAGASREITTHCLAASHNRLQIDSCLKIQVERAIVALDYINKEITIRPHESVSCQYVIKQLRSFVGIQRDQLIRYRDATLDAKILDTKRKDALVVASTIKDFSSILDSFPNLARICSQSPLKTLSG